MKRRGVSAEERAEFEAAFREARPLAPLKRGRKEPSVTSGAAPSGIDGGMARALDKGRREPDARIDLHGMTENVAHRALATFLRGAQMRGARLVLVVTGKGVPDDRIDSGNFDMLGGRRGVLKASVPRWLKQPELAGFIADIRPAHRRHGGGGALYVYLRKK